MEQQNPLLGTYRRVFGSDEGVVVFRDLHDFIGPFDNRYYASIRKQERVLGMRDVLLFIYDRLGIPADGVPGALLQIPVPQPEERQKEAES